MIRALKRLFQLASTIARIPERVDEIKLNQGRILASANMMARFDDIAKYEFKVFSQWGEDGILQFLTSNLVIENTTFIEFGVEDFSESNCRFLMMKDYWSGFVIDGSARNIARLKSSYYYWKYPLVAKESFVTRENIASLLEESGFDKDLGVLSIDIDGVDYHVLEALENWRPRILVVEYNGIFGSQRAVTVPYDKQFVRNEKHFSNQYYGASLPAFCHLAAERGYGLVGVNGVGSNAFFVRKDLLNENVREVALTECFRSSLFREGRDIHGDLTHVGGWKRKTEIANLPLLDLATGATIRVAELPDEP